jgi:hypothetical protein
MACSIARRREACVTDVDTAATEAVMLRDGAMLTGYLGDAAAVSTALARGFHAIIDAHQQHNSTST